MELEITRWAVAVLVVAIPLAAAFARFMRYDQRVNESFTTRDDLLAHLNSGPLASFWMTWPLVIVVGGAFVAAVALVAHWLKVVGTWALG
jgi:hypothetical protein